MASPFAFSRSDLPVVTPVNVEEAAQIIHEAAAAKRAVLARGGGTKWSAGQQPTGDSVVLATTSLTGIIEYEPGELTFTAHAGTPLREIEAALAANGQYLPFDPPFGADGATLGGTVAAGLSGPRRMRYGGLRDFVIGVKYLNSAGEVVRSGGKVVKNAAGYDFSKLFCGSLGTLGILIEVSFKVFPLPQDHRTLLIGLKDAQAVQTVMSAVMRSPIEISAADAWPSGTLSDLPDLKQPYTVAIQIDGPTQSLDPRLNALRVLLPTDAATQILEGDSESALWTALRDVTWIGSEDTILRLYLPPNRLADLDTLLARARRVFSVGGNVGWAALAGDPSSLSPSLAKLGVQAAVWRAPGPSREILPDLPGAAVVKRVKQAFDPLHIFYPGRYAIS